MSVECSPYLVLKNGKTVDKVLVEAKVRNIKVGRIKMKVCRGSGMFEQALCEVVMYLFPDYSLKMNILCLTGECFCCLILQNRRQVTLPFKEY